MMHLMRVASVSAAFVRVSLALSTPQRPTLSTAPHGCLVLSPTSRAPLSSGAGRTLGRAVVVLAPCGQLVLHASLPPKAARAAQGLGAC